MYHFQIFFGGHSLNAHDLIVDNSRVSLIYLAIRSEITNQKE